MRLADLGRGLLRRLRPAAPGYADRLDARRAVGWAFDPADPDTPVLVGLWVDGRHVQDILAALPREDVRNAGRGPLSCGFDLALPARLRDGKAHRVELRLGRQRLPGGLLQIRAGAHDPEAAGAAETGRVEGLAWIDPAGNALVGWAGGTLAVEISIDRAPPQRWLLDREVPGFGAGNRQGFHVDLPAGLADGAWHEARVSVDGMPLDGSPLRFRPEAGLPRLVWAVLAPAPSARAAGAEPAAVASGPPGPDPALPDGAGPDGAGSGSARPGPDPIPAPGAGAPSGQQALWLTLSLVPAADAALPELTLLADGLPVGLECPAPPRLAPLSAPHGAGGAGPEPAVRNVVAPEGAVPEVAVPASAGPEISGPELSVPELSGPGPARDGDPRAAVLRARIPDHARHLVLRLGPPGGEGRVVARWLRAPGSPAGLESLAPAVSAAALDAARLDPALEAQAREAFARFCAAPDARFDPLWYLALYPGAVSAGADVAAAAGPGPDPGAGPAAAALAHWCGGGASAGAAPGPGFDERAARALHPAVARSVAEGRLPCAFALELVLGAGSLGSLTGAPVLSAPRPAARPGAGANADARPGSGAGSASGPAPVSPPGSTPAPAPEQAPEPPAACRDPARSIWAAWMARLELDPATGDFLAADEAGMRAAIAALPAPAPGDHPAVSIIMPSWNRAFTIGEAIQSVLEQSWQDWELLVCDDASTDRTGDVVRGFDDPRIRYLQFWKSNGAGARNHGLRLARGRHIAYLDSDNLWHPLFLELMLRQLVANPGMPLAYAGYLDTEISGGRVALQRIARPSFRPIPLASRNFIDLNSIVHHRRVTDWMGGFDPDLPRLQDWDMVLRHSSVFGARFIDHVGVYYRRSIAWGQVTQTQMASGAQGVVAAKTARRLAGEHERLRPAWTGAALQSLVFGAGPVSWPVSCGPKPGPEIAPAPASGPVAGPPATGAGSRLLAESLAGIAAGIGDSRLLLAGHGPEEGASEEGGPFLPQELCADPARLGAVLGGLAPDRVVILTGAPLPPEAAQRLPQALQLVSGPLGSELVAPARPGLRFPLGAVPLALPAAAGDAGQRSAVLVLGAFGPDADADASSGPASGAACGAGGPGHGWISPASLLDEARRAGLALILPPGPGDPAAHWQGSARAATGLAAGPGTGSGPAAGPQQGPGTAAPGRASGPLADRASGLPAGLERVGLMLLLALPEHLPPFEMALLAALQGRGVPVALPDRLAGGLDRPAGPPGSAAPALLAPPLPGSLAAQWLGSGAALRLDPAALTGSVLVRALLRLLADPGLLRRHQGPARTAWSIWLHPDLVRERLLHALWVMQVEPPEAAQGTAAAGFILARPDAAPEPPP